jgi:hypothetical protein
MGGLLLPAAALVAGELASSRPTASACQVLSAWGAPPRIEARRPKDDGETRRLAKEWLPIDNEATELAEDPPADRADEEDPWWK